jgi:hypothetical protein
MTSDSVYTSIVTHSPAAKVPSSTQLASFPAKFKRFGTEGIEWKAALTPLDNSDPEISYKFDILNLDISHINSCYDIRCHGGVDFYSFDNKMKQKSFEEMEMETCAMGAVRMHGVSKPTGFS